MSFRRPARLSALVVATLVVTAGVASAQPKGEAALDPKVADAAKKSVDNGLRFLRGQQADDGSYGKHVGLTAMALLAFAESHRAYKYDEGPFISRAADWLAQQARADGAITGDATPTYNTALAIMALHAIDPVKYKAQIEGGQKFLVRFQSDENQKYQPSDKFYGGIGYGGDERPDLSNLQYALEALQKTDYDPDSDVWKKAQVFLNRCQNRSESNDQAWAGNDGGFVYAPGQSPAGEDTKDGKTTYRSYGAMSFAGLKSLMFAKAKKDDPRVKAAWEWVKANYDFNSHPGMGTTSYYYYLQTAASALETYGEKVVPDAKGRKRYWVQDLLTKMMALQQPNGAWKNENPKYWEGNELLATARAVITMNHALRAAGVQH
ncbi:MAG: terpene cyclase/mutase family protein [Myxococcales bacterium]|nr:terpene cyclase/mutase family protein [Myxococcales bacterium]